jgi:hypothetical protein
VKRHSGKAYLVFKEKVTLRNGLLRDGVIWRVPISQRYPDGIRYRLALVNPEREQLLVLFDNHHPKGHHRHLRNGDEISYAFRSLTWLVEDYLSAIEDEEGIHESEKN